MFLASCHLCCFSNAMRSESPNNSSDLKQWSAIFGEDGRLRYDQIHSFFPPSRDDDFTKPEKNIYWQTLEFTHFALSSYKETHVLLSLLILHSQVS